MTVSKQIAVLLSIGSILMLGALPSSLGVTAATTRHFEVGTPGLVNDCGECNTDWECTVWDPVEQECIEEEPFHVMTCDFVGFGWACDGSDGMSGSHSADGSCQSTHHPDCNAAGDDDTVAALITAVAARDSDALIQLLRQTGAGISVNHDRGALQVIGGCQQSLLATVPAPQELLRAADSARGMAF